MWKMIYRRLCLQVLVGFLFLSYMPSGFARPSINCSNPNDPNLHYGSSEQVVNVANCSRVDVEWEFCQQADRLEIWAGSSLLFTTNYVSGGGSASVSLSGQSSVIVKISAGSSNSGWWYSVTPVAISWATLSVDADPGGEAYIAIGSQRYQKYTVPVGSSLKVCAEAHGCYRFYGWSGYPGSGDTPCFLVQVNQNSHLHAMFKGIILYSPRDVNCVVGDSVSFSILLASGAPTGPTQFQWRKDGATIPSATNATLTIDCVMVEDAGHYDCIVTKDCGSEISETGLLTVGPLITVQPFSRLNHCFGTPCSFSVEAARPAIYQWRKNGELIPDATSPTLVLNSPRESDAGYYDCVVVVPCAMQVSDAAMLTVTTGTLTIYQQPVGRTACLGQPFVLSISAQGADSFRWYRNSVPLSNSNTPTLVIPSIQASDAGTYWCSAFASTCRVDSSRVQVSVDPLPLITLQPVSQTVCEGESIELKVEFDFNGTTPIRECLPPGSMCPGGRCCKDCVIVHWFRNGHEVFSEKNCPYWSNLYNVATLVLTNLSIEDSGAYHCRIEGAYCADSSDVAFLTVLPREAVTISRQPDAIQTVCVGDSARIAVEATGIGLQYQWLRDGIALSNGGRFVGTNTNVLTISPLEEADLSPVSYRCRITTAVTCPTTTQTLSSILERGTPVYPQIVSQPSPPTVCEQQAVALHVEANGLGLSYQWLRDGIALTEGSIYSGVRTATLNIRQATRQDASPITFTCRVTGNHCSLSTETLPVSLRVISPPQILTSSVSNNTGSVFCEGVDAIFSVTVADSLPVRYQWMRNNEPFVDNDRISGAQTSELTIQRIRSSDLPFDSNGYEPQIWCQVDNGICTPVSHQLGRFYACARLTAAIYAQGQKLPLGPYYLCGDAPLILNCSITSQTSCAGYKYQWKKDGVPIPGATSYELSISSPQPAENPGYSCIVWPKPEVPCTCAETTETTALAVRVVGYPEIYRQPQAQSVYVGSPAVFRVEVGPLDYSFSYEWYKVGDGYSVLSTSSTLTLQAAYPWHSGSYYCKVFSQGHRGGGECECLCEWVTSDQAYLQVLPNPTLSPSPTASLTLAPSPSISPTASPSISPTETPSTTPSPIVSSTVTPSPSASVTPTPSTSPSPLPPPTDLNEIWILF